MTIYFVARSSSYPLTLSRRNLRLIMAVIQNIQIKRTYIFNAHKDYKKISKRYFILHTKITLMFYIPRVYYAFIKDIISSQIPTWNVLLANTHTYIRVQESPTLNI